MLLPLVLLAGIVYAFRHVAKARAAGGRTVISASPPPSCGSPKLHPPLVGVAPDSPWGADLARFVKQTKVVPRLVASYVPFGSPFDAVKACTLTRVGAWPLIQMLPRRASLADITAGKYDTYLSSYARSIKKSGLTVVFSFAHEMNGLWYPWGYKHTSPGAYIAAWRHVHDEFTRAGATHVIWCWNPNGLIRNMTQETLPRVWWPGAAYVDWVGIDAYFNHPGQTYATAIGPSLATIRQFTNKPVLIAETAVPKGPQEVAQIKSLFAGIGSGRNLIGFIWFNHNKREVWRINGRPAAITAFRRASQSLS
jgi:hypothetical protein